MAEREYLIYLGGWSWDTELQQYVKDHPFGEVMHEIQEANGIDIRSHDVFDRVFKGGKEVGTFYQCVLRGMYRVKGTGEEISFSDGGPHPVYCLEVDESVGELMIPEDVLLVEA